MSSMQTPGYRTLSPDTAEWADRMLFEHWARMSTTEKADLVSELCLSARRLGRDVVEQVLGHTLPFPENGLSR